MERLSPHGAWARLLEPAARQELESLARESDDELYLEGLMALAGREERAGRIGSAVELYSTVLRDATSVGAVRERPLQTRAQSRLDAILGRGDTAPRAEFLLRNLAQQASDPAAIFAMGVAGSVFRMTRLATLSRLAATPSGNLLTRGIGARLTACAVGFLAEAPAFTAASRFGNAALGRTQDWSLGSVGREFAGGALTLLGLKVFGGMSGLLLRRFAVGPGLSAGFLRVTLPQASMLAGILSSHRLEVRLGLRDSHDGATEFTDALATLIQFHVGGRLAHQAFGEGHARGERLLELRSESLASLPQLESAPLVFAAPAMAGSAPEFPIAVFSVAAGSGRARGRRGTSRQLSLPYDSGLPFPRPRSTPTDLSLELRLAEAGRQADTAVLRSSLSYLRRQGRPLNAAEQILWIREHRLAGGIPILGERARENGPESAAALDALRSFADSHRTEVLSELRQSLRHSDILALHPILDALVALRATEALPDLRAAYEEARVPATFLIEAARVNLGDTEIAPRLRERAFTWQPSALDRISALESLGRLGSTEEVLPELRRFFRYGSRVYFRAGLALTRLGHDAAIPNPAAMLDAATPLERAEWGQAFWDSGRPQRARELWEPLLTSRNHSALETVLASAERHEIVELLPAIARFRAESPVSELRIRAAQTIIALARSSGNREGLEGLLTEVEPASVKATERLQIAAARARLAMGPSPEATERLETYLESAYPAHRILAAEGLLEAGEHGAARNTLESLWRDPNFEIRNRAFAAWGRVRAPRGDAGGPTLGGFGTVLAAATGLGTLLFASDAHAAVGMHASGSHDFWWLTPILGTLLTGGLVIAQAGKGGEGAGRSSDRPPHANLLGWFESPNHSEERYFLATPPETIPENQRFLVPPEPGQVLTIGRASSSRGNNLFPATQRNISRRHMDLQVRDGIVEIRVHDGSLGLRINDRNLAPFQWYALRDRDVVEFVSEGSRDVFGTEASAEEPGEFVTAIRRLGRNPAEETDAPATFVFRRPRPPETPVPPRPRHNLVQQVRNMFGGLNPQEAPAPEEPKRDSRPTASFRDPEEVFGEVQRLSNSVSDPLRLLEASMRMSDWLDPHEARGAAARRDVLLALIRIHRQICGRAEQIVTIETPAAGLARPSYQALRVPRWDGILRQRLDTYSQGLEQLRHERGEFPLYAVANQQLNLTRDNLNRLYEMVRQFRSHYSAPEDLARFDAIEAAYQGLRPELSEGLRVRTATRGIDVTVRRRQRQGWAEEFAALGHSSRAMVNMRILMGNVSETQGLPIASSLYSTLASSTVYPEGNRNVRVLFEASNGQIVAFDDGSPAVRRTLQQHRDQGSRIEEAMLSIDARGSGRIAGVVVLGEVRDSVRSALEELIGLRVLPPQVVHAYTGFAEEPDARVYRVDMVPDVDSPPEHWYRVAGLIRNLREGYSLLTLEANTPELGLPGLQLWVPSMEILDLSVGDPVTALPAS